MAALGSVPQDGGSLPTPLQSQPGARRPEFSFHLCRLSCPQAFPSTPGGSLLWVPRVSGPCSVLRALSGVHVPGRRPVHGWWEAPGPEMWPSPHTQRRLHVRPQAPPRFTSYCCPYSSLLMVPTPSKGPALPISVVLGNRHPILADKRRGRNGYEMPLKGTSARPSWFPGGGSG